MLGDTVFSWALRDAGFPMRLETDAVFRHDHVQNWRDFMRERFARGREFAGLRRAADEPTRRKVYDVALTVTLVRPARVSWRAVANARRAGQLRRRARDVADRRQRDARVVRRRGRRRRQHPGREEALMRVLMLAHNVSERGSAIRALSIARWLAAAGRDVTVLSGRRHAGFGFTDAAMDGVRLLEPPDLLPYRFRNGGLSPIDLAGRLAHVLRERYDVVHTFEPRPCATLPGLLARRRKSVWVADWADLWGPDGMAATWPTPQRVTLGAFDGVLQSYTRRRADAVTVISSDLERRAGLLGIPPERIRRIAVGANDDLFRPQPAAEARARYGLPDDALVLVHTGFAPFDDWLLAHTFAELAVAEPRAYLLMSGRRFPLVEERAAAVGARPPRRARRRRPLRRAGVGDGLRGRDGGAVHGAAAQRGALPEPRGRLPRRGPPHRDQPDRRPRPARRDGARRSRRAADTRSVCPRDPRPPPPSRRARRDGEQSARACRDDALVARSRRQRRRAVRRADRGLVDEGGRRAAIAVELVVRKAPGLAGVPSRAADREPERRRRLRDDHRRQVS